MAKNKPIVIKVTPTPKKTGAKGTPYEQYVRWLRSYKLPSGERPGVNLTPGMAKLIWQAAHEQNIDPIDLLGVVMNESRANPNVPDSSAGAIGLGQLMPSSFLGQPAPWNKNHRITEADLRNPGTNLRLAAWYIGQIQVNHPNDWYGVYAMGAAGAANHPQTAQQIQQQYEKTWYSAWPGSAGYVSTPPTSPASKAGTQAPGGTAPQRPDLTFKQGVTFVAGITQGRQGSGMQGGPEGAPSKGGKFITTTDPNKALQYNGAPLTISGFKSLTAALAPYYISYTGKRPTPQQIATFAQKNWSPFTLEQLLSKGPHFQNSPIYKQRGIQLNQAMQASGILAKGQKIPQELMRNAILYGWDETTVAQKLRQTPLYLQSNEFKGNVATLLNVQQSIMGSVDAQSMISIKDAALAGWNSDQYAAWLRSQPGYVNSQEYHAKAYTMLDALGALTGRQVTLTPGSGPTPAPGAVNPQAAALPQDKRVQGKATVSGGTDFSYGFS